MHKIGKGAIVLFGAVATLAAGSSIAITWLCFGNLPLGDFRGVALVAIAIGLFYLLTIAGYRIVLFLCPLAEGSLAAGSREEFAYHVYELFYLVLFYPLTRSSFLPVPVMRLVYGMLGARFGVNSYTVGTLLDPPLTAMGSNCIIGHGAVVICHALDGDRLSLAKVQLGDNVTVGPRAVLMPGVTVANGAIIAVNAVVAKGTHVGAGETWAGIPARKMQGGERTQAFGNGRSNTDMRHDSRAQVDPNRAT